VNAILSRIRELQSDLPPKARQIAALIIARPEIVVYMSMTDFSEACGVSEGTIVAFCRARVPGAEDRAGPGPDRACPLHPGRPS
jgi:hypothetical protein